MSLIDNILGRGGIDSTFSDWNEARNFVIFDTIVNNPRFSDDTKIKLQDVETQAYEVNYGKWLLSEKEEIAKYFTYLKNQFPSVTSDERFLAIYDSAANVRADEPSVGLEDLEIPEPVADTTKKLLIGLGLFGLLALVLRD